MSKRDGCPTGFIRGKDGKCTPTHGSSLQRAFDQTTRYYRQYTLPNTPVKIKIWAGKYKSPKCWGYDVDVLEPKALEYPHISGIGVCSLTGMLDDIKKQIRDRSDPSSKVVIEEFFLKPITELPMTKKEIDIIRKHMER